MIYFIESVGGDSVREPVVVVKIGFTENLTKRMETYNTHNFNFRLMKVLSDKSFDRKCEKILHYYLYSIGKRYKDRTELFILDNEVERFIDSINTREDIIKLQKNLSGKRRNFNDYLKKYKGILLKNRKLIEGSYNGDLTGLINCFIDSGLGNIFKFMKDYYKVDMLDFTAEEKDLLDRFFNGYNKTPGREAKLKYLCDFHFAGNNIFTVVLDSIVEKRFKEYLTILGPEKCRSVGYKISDLDKKLNIISFEEDKIFEEIDKEFEVGQSYTNAYIKGMLGEIYKRIGYKASPKANDLGNYFNIKPCTINENGKRVNGLRILSKKT